MIGRSGGIANSLGITALRGNAYSKTWEDDNGMGWDGKVMIMITTGRGVRLRLRTEGHALL